MYLSIVDANGRKIPAAAAAGEFEAAGFGRRLSTWGTSVSGPNTALFSSLSALRSRSRELSRNYSLANGAVDSFVANLVGSGITPRWQLEDPELKERVQQLWAEWAAEADADGVCDFYGLQALAARTLIEGGECFAHLRARRPDADLAVPLQVKLFEGDHVDETYNTVAAGGRTIRMGIELTADGRRAAYWPFKDHPGERFWDADTVTRVRIPAADVLHVFRPLRAGQMRGRPWMAPVIVEMHEIDQCVDAELVRRKTTAMFGGFVTRINAPGVDPGAILGRRTDETVVALEPGTFPVLPPGMDVRFAEPKDVSGNYVAWMKQELRNVARGIGITYEQLTGDLEGVTYSSIRAGLLEFRRLCTMIQLQTLVFQLCRPVARAWMDAAVLSGALPIDTADYLRNRRRYLRVLWRPEGWQWVDPEKDEKAERMAVRNGFKSRAQVVAENGFDVEEGDAEIAEDNARADKLGLVLDSDPRKTTAGGAYQETDDDDGANR
jgi:lambda family phage portal protein